MRWPWCGQGVCYTPPAAALGPVASASIVTPILPHGAAGDYVRGLWEIMSGGCGRLCQGAAGDYSDWAAGCYGDKDTGDYGEGAAADYGEGVREIIVTGCRIMSMFPKVKLYCAESRLYYKFYCAESPDSSCLDSD